MSRICQPNLHGGKRNARGVRRRRAAGVSVSSQGAGVTHNRSGSERASMFQPSAAWSPASAVLCSITSRSSRPRSASARRAARLSFRKTRGVAEHDGLTVWPLTRRGYAGGLHAYEIHISPERRTPTDESPCTRATTGSTSSAAGCACCSARTTSRSTPVTPSNSPPGAALVRRGAVVELIMIVGREGERMHLHVSGDAE